MDSIYQNSDYIRSKATLSGKCSQLKAMQDVQFLCPALHYCKQSVKACRFSQLPRHISQHYTHKTSSPVSCTNPNSKVKTGLLITDEKSHQLDRKTEVALPKWTKVLLILLSVSLVVALGGVCALGMFLSHVTHLKGSDQDHNATDYKGQFEALNNKHEETLRKLNRLNESTGCALCAVHWIHSGGKCYYFSTVRMNWTQSRDHCVTLGGHLVMINSKAEQDFLTSRVKETHWIGLNDLDIEGQWVWVNNQPLNDSIEFWIKRENGIREPDNWTKDSPSGEDCASLGHPAGETDFWSDASCFQKKRFVCEAPASV